MAFILSRESAIPSLGVVFQEYADAQSGAKHIHLKAKDTENAFMVSFPTVPRADDGRAHILEHISLCGSEKFPTRDPFFAMTRRSLATFMNAMTSPDHTSYPFASQDKQDFFNLLEVYLDAAFFPKLDRMDFLQEGWRLDFDEKGNLVYNGVVFNEMKEPMASPDRQLHKELTRALKPGTTYAFESGGDPLVIPSLTHQDLIEFHKTHYHPSRAVFWSYGSVDPLEIQSRIQSEVIAKISTRFARIEPDSAALPLAPRKVDLRIPSQGERAEHGFVVGWLLGEIGSDYEKLCDWQIFSRALFGDAASPMSLALEGAGFGRPDFCGLEDSSRQAVFYCGMAGLDEREVPKAREVIFSALERVARDGIPHARLESLLRDFELDSQEIRGGSTPHGLRALLAMAPIELNGGDPLRAIDARPILERARRDIADPEFVRRMARELIASPARVEARVSPDTDFLPARTRAEQAALKATRESMTPADIERVKRESRELQARQRAPVDASCLPRILPSQISQEVPASLTPQFEPGTSSAPARALVEAATNGVVYFTLAVDASGLAPQDWRWLNLGSDLAMQLGFAGMDFEQTDLWKSQHGSQFSCSAGASSASDACGSSMALRLTYSGRALEREAGSMARAVAQLSLAPRFDETERLAFLIQSSHQEQQQRISQMGAGLASWALGNAFGAVNSYSREVGGLSELEFLAQLDAQSRTPEGAAEISRQLTATFAKLRHAPALMAFVGSRDASTFAFAEAGSALGERAGPATFDAVAHPIPAPNDNPADAFALVGPGQLNYCHAAWLAPKLGHPDCGPLMVLAEYLRNTYLHRALREEGGAYGSGASMHLSHGYFGMSSYRDPRLAGTYADFDRAARVAIDMPIDPEHLDEAIISVMQGLDKPGAPRERASGALNRALCGIDLSMRASLRASVLGACSEDLRRVAGAYLSGAPIRRVAYVSPVSLGEAAELGLREVHVAPAPVPAAGVRP